MAECDDKNCPVHGNISIRGRKLTGKVISDRMHRTVNVLIERMIYVKKYNRYEKRFSKIKAHNSDCIGAKEGDLVEISETRPLSKTKSFVVTKIIEKRKE